MQTVTYYFESDYGNYSVGPYTRPIEDNEIYDDMGFDPYFDGYINGTDAFVETVSSAWYTGEFGNIPVLIIWLMLPGRVINFQD